jgi:hypothetical protein
MDRFWTEVAGILAKRGVILRPDGVIELDPHYQGTERQPSEDEIESLNDAMAWADIHSTLKLNWVREFVEVTDAIGEDGPSVARPFLAVFWLRLHGVLVELKGELSLVERWTATNGLPRPGSTLALGVLGIHAIEAVKRVFDEDELIYAEYRRHTEAHPIQTGYRLQWSKKHKKVLDERHVPALKKTMKRRDIDWALERVLKRYPNETAIAVDFARRVREPAHELLEIARPLYGGGVEGG